MGNLNVGLSSRKNRWFRLLSFGLLNDNDNGSVIGSEWTQREGRSAMCPVRLQC